MKRQLLVRSAAEADIAAAALWYEQQTRGLGESLLLVVGDAIRRAEMLPRAHLLLRRQPEVRRVLTAGFPYRVFFIVEPERLIVFRVLHGARGENPWTGAVSEPPTNT